jgi:serine phosphatase RsbU (regulator of sigma subunit)
MAKKIKVKILNWEKPSTKIIITVFSGLLILSGYFIFYINFTFLSNSEKQTLEKLNAIARTIAPYINGDKHELIDRKYDTIGSLRDNAADSNYYEIHKILKGAHLQNNLETEIATLVFNKSDTSFHYVVNSLDSPYIHDPFEKIQPLFITGYDTGAMIPQYTDEFDTWLSAIAPVKNSKGKTVAIVEVDQKFNTFITEARKSIYSNLVISLIIFVVTVVVILRYIRVIMVAEEKSKKKIEESSLVISQKNKDILDSINYARRIQSAILAPREEIFAVFKNAFLLYKPKDIVSGDFYYFTKTENKAVIAAADCTGHGVPGALMSMIGNDMLHQITREMKIEQPAAILDHLHLGVTNILKQDVKRDTKDGMDIAMLAFDFDFRKVDYAGAYRNLYVVRNGEMIEYKANKFPIGNLQQDRDNFKNHEIELEPGDMCYIFTDGYADQFGGEKGKKFMMKRFTDLLLKIAPMHVHEQEKILNDTIEAWRTFKPETDFVQDKGHAEEGEHEMEQVDDILVIGVRV